MKIEKQKNVAQAVRQWLVIGLLLIIAFFLGIIAVSGKSVGLFEGLKLAVDPTPMVTPAPTVTPLTPIPTLAPTIKQVVVPPKVQTQSQPTPTPQPARTGVFFSIKKVQDKWLSTYSGTKNCLSNYAQAVRDAVASENSYVDRKYQTYRDCEDGHNMAICMNDCRANNSSGDIYSHCMDGCYTLDANCDGYANEINSEFDATKKLIEQYCQ